MVRFGAIVLLCIVAAVVYGVVHDQVTARVCVEYFTIGHPPVFDTADLAITHGGGEPVQQVWSALFDTLEKEGLERIDPEGEPFDPTAHEAVMHEPGEGSAHVVDVMRAGYRWKGRVLRPAMVKVQGN